MTCQTENPNVRAKTNINLLCPETFLTCEEENVGKGCAEFGNREMMKIYEMTTKSLNKNWTEKPYLCVLLIHLNLGTQPRREIARFSLSVLGHLVFLVVFLLKRRDVACAERAQVRLESWAQLAHLGGVVHWRGYRSTHNFNESAAESLWSPPQLQSSGLPFPLSSTSWAVFKLLGPFHVDSPPKTGWQPKSCANVQNRS